MQDTALYQQILGLREPWTVKQVQLDQKARQVVIQVACEETLWGCPQCQRRMTIHDWQRRQWRHLDSCQFQTVIQAEVPVVKCPEHGAITVAVPWAEKYSRFTALFERLAIDVMLECSIKGACGILGISWDEADGIKQRAVARGLERKPRKAPERICVDEKSAARGQNYVTIAASVDGARTCVEYVGAGRAKESLDAWWRQFTAEELSGVQAVAMDMWPPFVDSTLAFVPQAGEKITHDPYHMVAHMNEAVNKVRQAEHRELSRQGDSPLSGTRMLWLYGQENIPENRRADFEAIKWLNLRTSRAWGLKEVFRSFWLCGDRGEAEGYFGRWYSWAIRSRLEPVKKVARMCKKRLDHILNYFDHKITNGPIEGLNNKIQGLIKKAFGYRSHERFVTDIFFHCGGLDLHPTQ
jgi:transposase